MNKSETKYSLENIIRISTLSREINTVTEGLIHTFYIERYGYELATRLNQTGAKNNRDALRLWVTKELANLGIESPVSGMRLLCSRLADELQVYDYIGNN